MSIPCRNAHKSGFDGCRPLSYPLPEFILSDVLELAQAHASYRFILSEESSNERRILVRIC